MDLLSSRFGDNPGNGGDDSAGKQRALLLGKADSRKVQVGLVEPARCSRPAKEAVSLPSGPCLSLHRKPLGFALLLGLTTCL